MKFIFAPDSFKGTLSASRVTEIYTKAAEHVFPDCSCISLPMADGGEGTMDIMREICGGNEIFLEVSDPLFNRIQAKYVSLSEDTALIEMAAASGLPLVPADKRDPSETTTLGTGQLIKHALDQGYTTIIIGLGGSATNDGGIGCMSALGVRFLDAKGCDLKPTGKNLINIASIDYSDLHPSIKKTRFIVMCDVDNPLLGEHGATNTFGPQKGADSSRLLSLEAGMTHFAEILLKEQLIQSAFTEGYGAAGGLAVSLAAFMKAQFASGIDTILKYNHFRDKALGADYCITGEGCTDSQSAQGKVLYGVAKVCRELALPLIALSGSTGDGYEKMFDLGMKAIYTAKSEDMDTEYALAHADELLYKTAIRLFSDIMDDRL